jgi:hypothetical protein
MQIFSPAKVSNPHFVQSALAMGAMARASVVKVAGIQEAMETDASGNSSRMLSKMTPYDLT